MLAVDLSILDAGGTVLHTWTLSDPGDVIGSTVGGNRYGWFATERLSVPRDRQQLADSVPEGGQAGCPRCPRRPEVTSTDVSGPCGALVDIDRSLAQGAIDEAVASGGDAKEIDEASKEMDQSAEELAKGKKHQAVDHYKHAWEHAQKALKKAVDD